MKSFIVFSALLCVATAQFGRPRVTASAPRGEEVLIIRSESENNGDGTYRYAYETSDGSQAEESGYLKPNGNDDPIQVAQGSFQYYSPEGQLIRLTYIADEGGFQPQGDHLPTPPPIPAEIQKSLDLIYSNNAAQASRPQSGVRPPNRRY